MGLNEQAGMRVAARLANGVRAWATGQLATWQRVVILGVVAVATTFGIFFWATGRLEAEEVGYTGLFVINLIGSASLLLPVPGAAAACIAAAPGTGLNPFVIGVVAGLGQGIGEITGYLAGKSGQSLLQRNRYYERVRGWMVRCGGAALFVFALIPNPIMDLAGLAAGSLGYPLSRYILFVVSGKVIRSIGLSYACYYGIEVIARLAS
jgi:membrane protein YqaA with SNARE-associated domain